MFQMTIKWNQHFHFLGTPKYTQIGISGLKIYHLATLVYTRTISDRYSGTISASVVRFQFWWHYFSFGNAFSVWAVRFQFLQCGFNFGQTITVLAIVFSFGELFSVWAIRFQFGLCVFSSVEASLGRSAMWFQTCLRGQWFMYIHGLYF
jgi:hypothetical protein